MSYLKAGSLKQKLEDKIKVPHQIHISHDVGTKLILEICG